MFYLILRRAKGIAFTEPEKCNAINYLLRTSFVHYFSNFLTFLLSLFWLDGFRNTNTAIYAVAISMLLISSF